MKRKKIVKTPAPTLGTEMVPATPIRSDSLPVLPDVQRVAEFIEFVRWQATPSWERDLKTQNDFAASYQVSPDTLTDWKRNPEFWPLVWRVIHERSRERIPDVVEGLYTKIASGKGSAAEVQLFLRLAGGEPKPADKR